MRHIVKPLLRRPLMPLLVVLQVALACAIACNALFLLQQKMAPLLAPDGIGDASRLVLLHRFTARGTPWPAARLRQVQADLRAFPDVAAASYAASMPMIDSLNMNADVQGAEGTGSTNANVYLGDDLVNALQLLLVAGRDFSPEEKTLTLDSGMGFHQSGSVIVTRAPADRLYPDGHALGQIIRYRGSPGSARTIVGIVQHLMRNDLDQDNGMLDESMLFSGVANHWSRPLFAVRLTTSRTDRICASLLTVLKRDLGGDMLPGFPPQCETYSNVRNAMLAQPRAAVWLLSGVTLIVLIVTLTGIAGMTGYWVQQRTRSIGVRRALGARRSDVLRELLIENLIVVGVGVIIGVLAAYGINLWLMQHYELLRLPVLYLPFGAALLLTLGQLAVLGPARRAANIPPIVATRAL